MAAPLAIACASLFAGVAAAPPLHPGQIGTDAALARATPVDGGGAVALTMPWDEPVAPANTTALGPPQILLPDGTATLAGLGSDVSSGGVPAVFVTGGTSGIPTNVLVAYHHAADTMTRTDPSCHLSWSVLAAIGKVESGHARGGAVDSSGRTLSPILGPVLSGGPYAAIRDTDGGRWDGNTAWDRAVGPMQFIPSSWRAHGVDGNGDGIADPSNIYDATLAAAGYLCTGNRDLSSTADLRAAIFGYNHSSAYVDTVLAWAQVYASGAQGTTPASGGGTVVLASGPGSTPRTTRPPHPTTPTPSPTRTPTATATPSQVPSDTPTATPTSATGQPTPTNTSSPTATSCPTDTPTPTGTDTPTDTPTPTPTPTSSDPSGTPSPTVDPCVTPTSTPTATNSQLPSPTSTP
jgi:hypothetical protein